MKKSKLLKKENENDRFLMESRKIEFLGKFIWVNVYFDKDARLIHYIDWEEDFPVEGKSFTPEEFELMLENDKKNIESVEEKFKRVRSFMKSGKISNNLD